MLHFVIISVCSRIVWMLYCVVFHFSDILSTKHAQTEARSFIKTLHSFNKRAQVTSLKMWETVRSEHRKNHPSECLWNNVQLSCFLNGWPLHHQCVVVLSVVHWFPKWTNLNKDTLLTVKLHKVKVLRKPKHRLPQVWFALCFALTV